MCWETAPTGGTGGTEKGPEQKKVYKSQGQSLRDTQPEKRKKEHNTRSCPISRWLEEVFEIRVQMTSRFILKMSLLY